MKKAVLFLTFNRLESAQKVFEQIALAKPPRLYFSSDGPREGVEGESEKVTSIRQWVLEHIDWDCDVITRFNTKNMGSAQSNKTGITWFFENEEEGIILEDDTVPSLSFFYFCEELLNHYKNDKRVWHISGINFLNLTPKSNDSYFFTSATHSWGWASWRDRWMHMLEPFASYDTKNLNNLSRNKTIQNYWGDILEKMLSKELYAWDYHWIFLVAKYNGLCAMPRVNLVSNVGYYGVHFNDPDSPFLGHKKYELENIIHPKNIELNSKLNDLNYEFMLPPKTSLYQKIRRYLASIKLLKRIYDAFKQLKMRKYK